MEEKLGVFEYEGDASAMMLCNGNWENQATVEHERADMGCFARGHFEKRLEIVYCNGTLMYVNLYGDRNLDRRNGEE